MQDRRPAANCDPYVVTSLIFKFSCLDEHVATGAAGAALLSLAPLRRAKIKQD